MLIINDLEHKAAEEINNELGADTLRTGQYSYNGIICEAVLHPSVMVVISAETDSKTMIIRNGKAYLLDSDRFYVLRKI